MSRSLGAVVNNPASELAFDGLLDSLVAIHEECKATTLKRLKPITLFLSRYNEHVASVKEKRPKRADFTTVQIIGRGAYGEVHLVRHNETQKLYALKVMSKCEMINRSESAFFWEERTIMSLSDSPWIVQAQYAFQDDQYLYLAMEYLAGGDLYSLQDKFDYIPEDWARFYTAELVLALETLHSMGYIHRDVKPDNLLIDVQGHLKLADFGTCVKMEKDGLVHKPGAAVGTPDYISPEVLESQDGASEYGRECDWWGVGVFLYELLYGGENPFYDESLLRMYSKIQNHKPEKLEFPEDTKVSKEAKDLIKKLLVRREKRLGRKDISQIKAHPFFKGIDWANLRATSAPYLPEVKSSSDVSNFAEVESREQPVQLFKEERTFSGNQLPFIGFTFSRTATVDIDKSLRFTLDRSISLSQSITDDPMSNKAARLENELEKTKTKLKEILAESSTTKQQLHDAEEKIGLMEKKHVSEQERVESINNIEIRSLETKINSLEKMKEEKKRLHESEMEDLKRQIENERATVTRQHAKIERQKKEMTVLQERKNQFQDSTVDDGEKVDFDSKLLVATKTATRLKGELDEIKVDLKSNLLELNKRDAKIGQLETQLQEEKDAYSGLEVTVSSLKKKLGDMTEALAASERIASLHEDTINTWKQTQVQYQKEIEELKLKNDETKLSGEIVIDGHNQHFEDEIKKLRSINIDIITQLEAREDEVATARLQVKKLTSENKRLKEDMEDVSSKEIDELKRKVLILQGDLRDAQSDLSDETFAKEEILKKLNSFKHDAEAKQSTIDDLIEEVDKATSTAASLRSQLEKFSSDAVLSEKRLGNDIFTLESELEDSIKVGAVLGDQLSQKQKELTLKSKELEEQVEKVHKLESLHQKDIIEFNTEKQNLLTELEAVKEKFAAKSTELANATESHEKQVELLLAAKNELMEEKDALSLHIDQVDDDYTSKLLEVEQLNSTIEELKQDLQLVEVQKAQALKMVGLTQEGKLQRLPPSTPQRADRRQTQHQQKIVRKYEVQIHSLEKQLRDTIEENKRKMGETNEEYGRMIEDLNEKQSAITSEKENIISELEAKCDALNGTVSAMKQALEKVESDEQVKQCLSPALKRHLDTVTYGYQGWVSVPTGSKKSQWKSEYAVLDMEGMKLYNNETEPGVVDPIFTIRVDEIHSANVLHSIHDLHADSSSLQLVFSIKAVLIDRTGVLLQTPAVTPLLRRSSSTTMKMVKVNGHCFARFNFKKSDNLFCNMCSKPLKGHLLKHVGMKCQICGLTAHVKHFEEEGSSPQVHSCPGNITAKDYMFKAPSLAEQHAWMTKIEETTRRRGELKSKMVCLHLSTNLLSMSSLSKIIF
eukprot:m.72047 g.72047  ORF g.72047 m.72047 type:complete len:1349 (-) comp8367_c0_seq4:454-4500(-)